LKGQLTNGRASRGETNPSKVLEHARQDNDVGAARAVRAHLDEVVVGDVEVERRERFGAERCGEDGVEAVERGEGESVKMSSRIERQPTRLR
jgi:hypothetical protein